MKRLLKDFLRVKKIAGINVNTLKTYLEQNASNSGNVVINGRALGCISMRYKIKCKSSQCFLIQKEINRSDIGQQNCARCHLAFLEAHEQGSIQLKK